MPSFWRGEQSELRALTESHRMRMRNRETLLRDAAAGRVRERPTTNIIEVGLCVRTFRCDVRVCAQTHVLNCESGVCVRVS